MTLKADFQVDSDLNYHDEVLSWFDCVTRSIIPDQTQMECRLALSEGWTNAVRHGHEGLPVNTPVDTEVKIAVQTIEIRIWDRGSGFDLEQKLQEMEKTTAPDDEGGRGLLMMWKLGDRLSYTRTADNRNCLLFVKYYSDESG